MLISWVYKYKHCSKLL